MDFLLALSKAGAFQGSSEGAQAAAVKFSSDLPTPRPVSDVNGV